MSAIDSIRTLGAVLGQARTATVIIVINMHRRSELDASLFLMHVKGLNEQIQAQTASW